MPWLKFQTFTIHVEISRSISDTNIPFSEHAISCQGKFGKPWIRFVVSFNTSSMKGKKSIKAQGLCNNNHDLRRRTSFNSFPFKKFLKIKIG